MQVPLTQVRGYWQHRTDAFTHSSGEVRTSKAHCEPLATQAAFWRVHSWAEATATTVRQSRTVARRITERNLEKRKG